MNTRQAIALLALVVFAVVALLFFRVAHAEGCLQAPYGVAGVPGDFSCRPDAIAVWHDANRHGPVLVEYVLTGDHSFGCVDRGKFSFYRDPELRGSAVPGDYAKSGFDLGHMAPAQDGAWSTAAMREFFTMANISPQLPGLNRVEWERLEETVRAWAWARGPVTVFVGPVFSGKPKTIGKTGVAVPVAFFKVVVLQPDEAIAFLMPNKDEAKGDLEPWIVSIEDVEASTGFPLPLPEGVDKHRTPSNVVWPDLSGWRVEHKKRCGHG